MKECVLAAFKIVVLVNMFILALGRQQAILVSHVKMTEMEFVWGIIIHVL